MEYFNSSSSVPECPDGSLHHANGECYVKGYVQVFKICEQAKEIEQHMLSVKWAAILQGVWKNNSIS